jgi:hypothetical protein
MRSKPHYFFNALSIPNSGGKNSKVRSLTQKNISTSEKIFQQNFAHVVFQSSQEMFLQIFAEPAEECIRPTNNFGIQNETCAVFTRTVEPAGQTK